MRAQEIIAEFMRDLQNRIQEPRADKEKEPAVRETRWLKSRPLREFDPGPEGFGPFRLYSKLDESWPLNFVGEFATLDDARDEMYEQKHLAAQDGIYMWFYIMDGTGKQVDGYDPNEEADSWRMANKVQFQKPDGLAENPDLEEGWRDTVAGLALGGLAMTAGAHVVKPGDTVYSIARANNTTPAAIARVNGLGPDFTISVGQRLRIPGGRDVLDAQRRAELARLGYADRAAPADRPAPAAKPKATTVNQPRIAEPKSTTSLDPKKTWTGTRGEALVTQAALRSGIRKRSELAALLAQTAHESNNFRTMGEDLSYSAQGLMKTFPTAFPNARIASQYANRPQAIANRAYANRMGNGSEKSGDGWRYRGRGYIQLTGRENYQRAGRALGMPLERQPDLASKPEVAAQIAVWYWQNRTRPNVRDFYDVRGVTATINPAQSHVRSREENFADFYQWLGNREQRT